MKEKRMKLSSTSLQRGSLRKKCKSYRMKRQEVAHPTCSTSQSTGIEPLNRWRFSTASDFQECKGRHYSACLKAAASCRLIGKRQSGIRRDLQSRRHEAAAFKQAE